MGENDDRVSNLGAVSCSMKARNLRIVYSSACESLVATIIWLCDLRSPTMHRFLSLAILLLMTVSCG